MSNTTGVLLLNIGSPRSYQVEDVKAYLINFLMDRDVIDLPWVVRYPLVNWLIVPKRGPFSAANYKKVWMEGQGSPLTVYSEHFAKKLQADLGDDYSVKVAMRYAEPTIDRALAELAAEGVEKIILAPMFPQYAEATTGSSVKYTLKKIKENDYKFSSRVLPAFPEAKAFVEPSVQITKEELKDKEVDHYLFSFHGLPESHIKKVCNCLSQKEYTLENHAPNCYRGQCLATATRIAEGLGLSTDDWSLSFQSRLGRAEWLKPSTDEAIKKVADAGKKNLAVLCPSFVADCIETLEEIGIGGEELFHEHGGKEFHLVPCVNENPGWVQGFADLLRTLP